MTSQPFAVPALLLFIFSIPLLFDLIPRNRFYGIRTSKTLSDSSVWYRVNRLSAAAIMSASGIYGIVAILVPYDPLARDNFLIWGIHLAAFVVPAAIGLVLVIQYAKRL